LDDALMKREILKVSLFQREKSPLPSKEGRGDLKHIFHKSFT